MPNATTVGTAPLPEDYNGSISDLMFKFLSGTTDFPGPPLGMGDKEKAMKAVYEVIVGEGVGVGKEAETMLLLGTDMTARAKATQETFRHALETWKDVTDYVMLEK